MFKTQENLQSYTWWSWILPTCCRRVLFCVSFISFRQKTDYLWGCLLRPEQPDRHLCRCAYFNFSVEISEALKMCKDWTYMSVSPFAAGESRTQSTLIEVKFFSDLSFFLFHFLSLSSPLLSSNAFVNRLPRTAFELTFQSTSECVKPSSATAVGTMYVQKTAVLLRCLLQSDRAHP